MKNLFIVTVTYGERNQLLQESIKSLSNIEFKKLIIIDNNSSFKINDAPEVFRGKISHIKLNENTGSANGYKIGIEIAYNQNAEYVLLLDDDNKLLSSNFQLIENIVNNSHNLIYALNRTDQWGREKILQSRFLAENNYNSFLNFNIKNKFLNLKNYQNNDLYSAPFGGMLIPRSAISKVGLPNADFYLYADDTEYCLRLRENGYSIKFIEEIKISDIEESWYMNKNLSSFDIRLKLGTDLKTYYTTRNNSLISKKYLKRNNAIFLLNKYIYITLLFIRAVQINKLKRFFLIKKAINDGESGRLGINKEFILK